MSTSLSMRKLYMLCCFLVISAMTFSQTAWLTPDTIPIPGKADLVFLKYLPPVSSPTQRPLIIYLHGIDSRGADVWKVDDKGIPEIVRLTPTTVTNGPLRYTWNGTTESFVVLAPLCPTTYNYWPADYVDGLITYALSDPTLNVDPNRVILTGFSLGGGGVLEYIAAAGATRPAKLAAAAPLAPGYGVSNPNFDAGHIAGTNLPYWGFHSTDDPLTTGGAQISIDAFNLINAESPAVVPKFTLWTNKGHLLYEEAYYSSENPGLYSTNGPPDSVVTIFEWFLAQKNNVPANILPTANAGADFSSAGPAVTLNGSGSTDSDGTLVRYVWRAISAPAGVSLSSITIANPVSGSPSTTASNLTTPGNYTFRLYAVDNRAEYRFDEVVVTIGGLSTKAMTFTSGGKIQSTNVTELNGTSKFTLEAHFKYDATLSGWTTILRKMNTLTDRVMLHIGPSNNNIVFIIGNTVDARVSTPTNSLIPGNWYHVAAVFDGTQPVADRAKIYLNGVAQTVTPSGGAMPSTTSTNTSPFIAGGELSCCYLNGTLDEVRVWKTALSASTISAWKDKQLGACHPNAPDLSVYWPLDDNSTSGVVAAGLTTTYTGVIFNGTYVSSTRATATAGCTGPKAVSITSSTGRIQTTGDVPELNGISKFTIEAQVKYNAAPVGTALATLFRKSTGGITNRIIAHLGSNHQLSVIVAGGVNTYGTTASNVVSAGTWHHIAAVYDGTLTPADRLKLYINGVLTAMSFPAGYPPAATVSNNAPFIAGGEVTCCYLNGTIEEVRVWNTALSPAVINAWKNQLLDVCHENASNLVLYWPLDNSTNPGIATAGLTTSYSGTITNGTYVASTQATTQGDCGSPAVLSDANGELPTDRRIAGRLYPNPAHNSVRLDLTADAAKTVTIAIFDVQGRFVRQQQRALSSGYNQLNLDISSLRSGTYFIYVRDERSSLGKYTLSKQ